MAITIPHIYINILFNQKSVNNSDSVFFFLAKKGTKIQLQHSNTLGKIYQRTKIKQNQTKKKS